MIYGGSVQFKQVSAPVGSDLILAQQCAKSALDSPLLLQVESEGVDGGAGGDDYILAAVEHVGFRSVADGPDA